jgi:hypothetical protein
VKPKVMMDSGAYSAWTMKKEIDVGKYCDFLLENGDWIDRYIALDVIIPDDTDMAAAKGFENYKYMRRRGLNPMPVFHQGEDIRYLYMYRDEGADYIGLAATSLAQKQQIDFWYEIAWTHLVNKDGMPLIRVHAFGDTRERALRAFPWASCDSASWAYGAQVHATFNIESGYDRSYGKQSRLALSQRNDFRSNPLMRDVTSFDVGERDRISEYLQKYGVDFDTIDRRALDGSGQGRAMRYDPQQRKTFAWALMVRTYLMMLYYKELEARIKALFPNPYHPRIGFAERAAGFSLPDTPTDPNYKQFDLYFAVAGNYTAFPVMRAINHEYMLPSYFYMKTVWQTKAYVADPDVMVYAKDPCRRYALALDEVLGKTNESRSTLSPVEPLRPIDPASCGDAKLSRPSASD